LERGEGKEVERRKGKTGKTGMDLGGEMRVEGEDRVNGMERRKMKGGGGNE
jgi:hypothetical protein